MRVLIARCRIAARAFPLALICACAMPGTHVPGTFTTEFGELGDTVVARTVGAASPLAELSLVRDLAIGKVYGGDQEMFGRLRHAAETSDGSIILAEFMPYRVQRLDLKGTRRRTYGARGQGPGEWVLPMHLAVGAADDVIVWAPGPNAVSVYDSTGRLRATWGTSSTEELRPVVGGATDSTGIVSTAVAINVVNGRGDGLDETSVIIRSSLDGAILDSLVIPKPDAITSPTVTWTMDGRARKRDVPLSPRIVSHFIAPDRWATANSGAYAILVQRVGGALLRIESDLPPTATRKGERTNLAGRLQTQLTSEGGRAAVSESDMPLLKPFFTRMLGDQSGRIWVALHTTASRTTTVECPPTITVEFGGDPGVCEDGRPPRPMERWVEGERYDIFAATGEFLGRLELPERSHLLNAKADRVWLAVRDSLDVEQLVRFRVQPRAGSPAASHWQQRQ